MPRKLMYERAEFQRTHRILGNYLVLCCWVAGVDALVLDRNELQGFYGTSLQHDPRRVKWLVEDLTEWFPYSVEMTFRTNTPASLYLSRVPFDGGLPSGRWSDDKRVQEAKGRGLKISLYKDIDLVRHEGLSFPTVQEIARKMVAVATGDLTVHQQLMIQTNQPEKVGK